MTCGTKSNLNKKNKNQFEKLKNPIYFYINISFLELENITNVGIEIFKKTNKKEMIKFKNFNYFFFKKKTNKKPVL